MNTISNNKLVLLTAVTTLMINGCAAKSDFQKTSFSQPKSVVEKATSWKNITKKKDECPDCYAVDIGAKEKVQLKSFEPQKELITYDYSKAPNSFEDSYVEYKAKISAPSYVDKVIDTQSYGTYDYSEALADNSIEEENFKVTPKLSYVNSSRDSFNAKLTSDTTIQVGAFRHYSGAKKIAKKYSLLSSQYSVKIETGMKENKPIHRVRISGFHSKGQAKSFMERYASNDAFLVRR